MPPEHPFYVEARALKMSCGSIALAKSDPVTHRRTGPNLGALFVFRGGKTAIVAVAGIHSTAGFVLSVETRASLKVEQSRVIGVATATEALALLR